MTIINYSKKKSISALVASVLFTVVGVLLLMDCNFNWSDKTMQFVAGVLCLAFFGFGSFFIFYMVFFSPMKQGLLIDDSEIVLLPAVQWGKTSRISWKDIDRFVEMKIHHNKMIGVHVRDVEQFIMKQPSEIGKKSMKAIYAIYGVVTFFPASLYDISHESLLALLNDKLAEYKKTFGESNHRSTP